MKSKNKDEQSINSYLLGQGTEEEQKSIEDRYFRDADFYEQILAQEDELIHDYLKESLSPSKKALFEKHFLHSERRRQKFLFVKSLINYADEHSMPQTTAAAAESRLSRWLDAFRAMLTPPMIAMASAALLLITLSTAFLSYKYRDARPTTGDVATVKPLEIAPVTPPPIAPQPQASAQPATPASPVQRQTRPDSGAAARKNAPSSGGEEANGAGSLTASIPAFVFSSFVARDNDLLTPGSAIYPVHFAADTPVIQMNANLPDNVDPTGSASYEVVISTIEGREVFRLVHVKPVVTPKGPVIRFPIHTALLEDGDYALHVNSPDSTGRMKPVSEMFFSAKRF
ncbi:MAG: hypothetical protein SF339_17515 [Blastocatellia bacterium]|nr:hypothetical protein [Blastocatellia bacterium]